MWNTSTYDVTICTVFSKLSSIALSKVVVDTVAVVAIFIKKKIKDEESKNKSTNLN